MIAAAIAKALEERAAALETVAHNREESRMPVCAAEWREAAAIVRAGIGR
jgi:hypothetical protein